MLQQPSWLKHLIHLHLQQFVNPASFKSALATSAKKDWGWTSAPEDPTLADHISLPFDISFQERAAAHDVFSDLTLLLLSTSACSQYVWASTALECLMDPKSVDKLESQINKLINGTNLPPQLWADAVAKTLRRVPYTDIVAFAANQFLHNEARKTSDNVPMQTRIHATELPDLTRRLSSALSSKDPTSPAVKRDLLMSICGWMVDIVSNPDGAPARALKLWAGDHNARFSVQHALAAAALAQYNSWPAQNKPRVPPAPVSSTTSYNNASAASNSNSNNWGSYDWKSNNGWGTAKQPYKRARDDADDSAGSRAKRGSIDAGFIPDANRANYEKDHSQQAYAYASYEFLRNQSGKSVSVENVTAYFNERYSKQANPATTQEIRTMLLANKRKHNGKGNLDITNW